MNAHTVHDIILYLSSIGLCSQKLPYFTMRGNMAAEPL
ncbi:hypothetical protein KNP414_02391 [Paenibacillus mucilaginosus KNP414]|uniref:Uncharacterized protein n=1 Tax=Paenibacillus mucilaginosus (strain KNP414) TaxID=1036673 RepID=F8F5E1_PAEMK|nr:hypothetical protein KNP414_02391 [Paenibacillus mucilaginosus KNP414]